MSTGKLVAALTNVAKEGEVWRINHERKGRFTVRLGMDVNLKPCGRAEDGFFNCVIVEGKSRYLNAPDRGPGEEELLRGTLTTFEDLVK